jgi:hypothetical protein
MNMYAVLAARLGVSTGKARSIVMSESAINQEQIAALLACFAEYLGGEWVITEIGPTPTVPTIASDIPR